MPINTMYIDGTAVTLMCMPVDAYSVLQQCELAGLDMPRFCYHDQLSIAGNCRICLVESDTSNKIVVSCATEVIDGMSVVTNSLLIKQARENVLEFLLINHPLDCPICDQGGECDLQDISRNYGGDSTRFSFEKRSVSDKSFGPLIKTVMTRCIHCTRCVRFFEEIAGLPSIGTVGRGKLTEIDTYFDSISMFETEITGNVIDLCPVGALTSQPYAFVGRPWELVSTESLDILDSLCSNIRIDTRGSELLRILPRLNYLVNNEWITDKIRFSVAGINRQRLLVPMHCFKEDLKYPITYNLKKGGKYICSVYHIRKYERRLIEIAREILPHVCSWEAALDCFRSQFVDLKEGAYFFAGHLLDCSSFYFFNFFCNAFGVSNINVHINNDSDLRLEYLLSNSLSSLFTDSSVFLILGLHLKLESPILNIRLKNCTFNTESIVRIGYIGTNVVHNYPIIHLGFCSRAVCFFFFGRSFFSYALQHVVCLTGNSIGTVFSTLLRSLSSTVFSTNYISLYTGDINMHELCVLQSYNSRSMYTLKHKYTFLYLLGADFLSGLYRASEFVVYHGHTYDELSVWKDLPDYMLIPSSSFLEREGLFINCQGKCQVAGQAIAAAGDAASNESTIYALYRHILDKNLLHKSFSYISSMFKNVLPYRVNAVSSYSVCFLILKLCPIQIFHIVTTIVYIKIRRYFRTDVFSRLNRHFAHNVRFNNYQ